MDLPSHEDMPFKVERFNAFVRGASRPLTFSRKRRDPPNLVCIGYASRIERSLHAALPWPRCGWVQYPVTDCEECQTPILFIAPAEWITCPCPFCGAKEEFELSGKTADELEE